MRFQALPLDRMVGGEDAEELCREARRLDQSDCQIGLSDQPPGLRIEPKEQNGVRAVARMMEHRRAPCRLKDSS